VVDSLMDDEGKKPDWLPDWFPGHSALKFTATTLQVLILGMAFGFLLYHLVRGKVDTAVGILGNQAT
jgi:hypothetical protein